MGHQDLREIARRCCGIEDTICVSFSRSLASIKASFAAAIGTPFSWFTNRTARAFVCCPRVFFMPTKIRVKNLKVKLYYPDFLARVVLALSFAGVGFGFAFTSAFNAS